MTMNAVQLSLITLVSTTAGGLCAFRLGDRLHLVLGFTSGALLGVVSFDLLPEIFELSHRIGSDGQAAMLALAVGFLLFHGLETFVLVHTAHAENDVPHRHPRVGVLSAAAMIGHSFVDGVGIGLAYQVSPATGFTVAIAVIAHDFCDGLNSVSLMLIHRNARVQARQMLALNAAAPILGALSTFGFSVPPETLVLYLGFFAGFLLYIGTSEVLPRTQDSAGSAAAMKSIGLTVLGASCVYLTMRAVSSGL